MTRQTEQRQEIRNTDRNKVIDRQCSGNHLPMLDDNITNLKRFFPLPMLLQSNFPPVKNVSSANRTSRVLLQSIVCQAVPSSGKTTESVLLSVCESMLYDTWADFHLYIVIQNRLYPIYMQ